MPADTSGQHRCATSRGPLVADPFSGVHHVRDGAGTRSDPQVRPEKQSPLRLSIAKSGRPQGTTRRLRRADPVNRDDALLLLADPARPGNLHDVITAAGHTIQLTVWPEEFVIAPDPAPPGTNTGPRPHAAGDIVILAALPDPAGVDRGHETVTLINTTSSGIDLTGWHLADAAAGTHALTGGAVTQIALGG